jgi:hypothetical protein
MKIDTYDIAEMLDGQAVYYITEGIEQARNALIWRCLDPEDFMFTVFMGLVLLHKKRRILM